MERELCPLLMAVSPLSIKTRISMNCSVDLSTFLLYFGYCTTMLHHFASSLWFMHMCNTLDSGILSQLKYR